MTKFGQRILQAPIRSDHEDVYWASGVYVVRIMSDTRETDEFIRQYLELHPRSL